MDLHTSICRSMALTASVASCADKEYPFSGISSSGRVWRKVPESDARCVKVPESDAGSEGAGKRCWE